MILNTHHFKATDGLDEITAKSLNDYTDKMRKGFEDRMSELATINELYETKIIFYENQKSADDMTAADLQLYALSKSRGDFMPLWQMFKMSLSFNELKTLCETEFDETIKEMIEEEVTACENSLKVSHNKA